MMKIENLTDERYNEELEVILKEKGIIDDGDLFFGFDFDDMTFDSVEELNKFIDKENYPDDYNVERVRNEEVYTPE